MGVLTTKNKNRSKNRQLRRSNATNSGTERMSLGGFKQVMWPTCLPTKLVYSDDRAIVASASQADYVYRANSIFDPDSTGVGGNPDGYEQLKTLYSRYRVMAVEVEAEAFANQTDGNGGILVVGPSETSASYASAEEVAGLRGAKSAMFTTDQVAKVRALYHIGWLLGYSDEAMLGNSNVEAAVSANPAFQQYIHVAIETNGGATNSTVIFTKLTYYVRMEVPIQVIDTVSFRRQRALCGTTAPAKTGTPLSKVPSLVEKEKDTPSAPRAEVTVAEYDLMRAQLALLIQRDQQRRDEAIASFNGMTDTVRTTAPLAQKLPQLG